MKGIFTVQEVLHFKLSSSETELGAEVAGVLDKATGSYYGQLNGWLVGVSFFCNRVDPQPSGWVLQCPDLKVRGFPSHGQSPSPLEGLATPSWPED